MLQYTIQIIDLSWDIEKQERFLEPHICRDKWDTIKMETSIELVNSLFLKSSEFQKNPYYPGALDSIAYAGLYKHIPVFVHMNCIHDMIVITKQEQ